MDVEVPVRNEKEGLVESRNRLDRGFFTLEAKELETERGRFFHVGVVFTKKGGDKEEVKVEKEVSTVYGWRWNDSWMESLEAEEGYV